MDIKEEGQDAHHNDDDIPLLHPPILLNNNNNNDNNEKAMKHRLKEIKREIQSLEEERLNIMNNLQIINDNKQEIQMREGNSLSFLSYDIIKILLSFLSNQKKLLFYDTNHYNHTYKRATYYYRLNTLYSYYFLTELEFQDYIIRNIDITTQLHITYDKLNFNRIEITEDTFNIMKNVHSVRMIKPKAPSRLCPKVISNWNSNCLSFRDMISIESISDLNNMDYIITECCNSLNSIARINNVTEIKVDNTAYSPQTRSTISISDLTNVNSLKLRNISIRSISNLVNVREIYLDHASLFEEAMKEFVQCVKDPRANVQLLSVENIYSMTADEKLFHSLLEGIKHVCLDLNSLDPLPISLLAKCTTLKLHLRDQKNLPDISPLKNGNVETLKLQYSKESTVTGFRDSLETVKDLELIFVDITDDDLVSLAHMDRVSLKYCRKIKNIMPLVHVKDLTINSCRSIRDYGSLINERIRLNLSPLKLCLFVNKEPSKYNLDNHIKNGNVIMIQRK